MEIISKKGESGGRKGNKMNKEVCQSMRVMKLQFLQVNRITNIIVQYQVKMNSSLLRIVAGYSRFALQEERKHNRLLGTFFHSEAYKKIYLTNDIIEGHSLTSQLNKTSKTLNYINSLTEDPLINKNNVKLFQHQCDNIDNQINALQYQANTTIEDRLVVATLKSINAETISVFDGHGGDKLSDYCANHVVELIDSFLQKNKNDEKYIYDTDKLIADALISAYDKLDKDFFQNIFKPLLALNNRKIRGVGTCALTAIMYNQKIYVANCGDSQAIAVLKDKNGVVSFIDLNQRFSVNNPSERARLKKQFPDDEDIIVQQRAGCFYLKGRLQPTRALGDYHLKYSNLFKGKGQFNGPYIKNTPDIKIFEMNEDFKAIVLASDGVWDFINKKEVAESSLEKNPHEKILQETLKKVAELHKKTFEQIKNIQDCEKRAFHDDISIAVISIGSKNKQFSII